MSQSEEDTRRDALPTPRMNFAEVVSLLVVWGFGFLAIWLVVTNYHDGQKVSLENAVGYIMIGVIAVSLAIMFRDVIVEVVRHWLAHPGERTD